MNPRLADISRSRRARCFQRHKNVGFCKQSTCWPTILVPLYCNPPIFCICVRLIRGQSDVVSGYKFIFCGSLHSRICQQLLLFYIITTVFHYNTLSIHAVKEVPNKSNNNFFFFKTVKVCNPQKYTINTYQVIFKAADIRLQFVIFDRIKINTSASVNMNRKWPEAKHVF